MYESQLDSPADRFLSLCLQHAVGQSFLTPEDINQEFPVATLVEALESDDDLRAQLLIEAAGVHEKIAAKKSIAAAAEDLQLALDEGVCTPETILEIVTIDDHVEFLDQGDLWALLTRDAFYNQSTDRAKERMLFMINTAIDQGLIDLPRLIRAIKPAELARLLPRNLVEEVFSAAVEAGLDNRGFSPDRLLALVPLTVWLQHIPLKRVWEVVVEKEIAAAANLGALLVDDAKEPASPKAEAPATVESGAPAQTTASSSAEEEAARGRAIAALEDLERLPRRVDGLSTPALLALEAMYAEFFDLESEEEQADCVREAFPNSKLLEEALLAMAETLDPRLSEEQLRSRGADAAGLVQLILFEERRLARQGQSSPPSGLPISSGLPASSGPPPLPPGALSSNVPPPPPPTSRKPSVPPPPLPAQATRRN
jgi:hypothetical protein